jgi:hypothetical protein
MLTYSGLLARYKILTKNNSSENETLGAAYINESIRAICAINGGKWPFLELQETTQTIAGREYVTIPNNIRTVMSFRYVQGDDPNTNTTFIPRVLFDSQAWESVLALHLGNSNWPWFAYQQDRRLLFRPIPSTTGNHIMLRGRANITDLSIADYTTGTITAVPLSISLTGSVASGATSATLNSSWSLPTGDYTMFFDSGEQRIVSLTNAATTCTWDEALTAAATSSTTVGTETGGAIVTGSGTTWTRDMIGRAFRITQTTAANGGDGYWYSIGAYYDATHIGLTTPYEGTAITAGSAAYTIGQVPIIPEAYQMAIIYRAAAIYWSTNNPANPNTELANSYWRLYDNGVEAGLSEEYGGLIGQMKETYGESMEGPYISPMPRDGYGWPGAPYWDPWRDAHGNGL